LRRRALRWLFWLSRARTRRRYGPEFQELVEELAESGQAGFLFLVFDTVRGIGLERWASRTLRRLVVPLAVAAGLTMWAVSQGGATGFTPDARSSGLAYYGPLTRLFDLPGGTTNRPTACPAVPDLSTPMPAGVVYSPPSVAPGGLWTLSAAGESHSLSQCSYVLRDSASASP
jgi:hypothetical protein